MTKILACLYVCVLVYAHRDSKNSRLDFNERFNYGDAVQDQIR